MSAPARSPKSPTRIPPRSPEDALKSELQKDVDRLHKARKAKRTAWAYAAYLGTLGVMLALPIVAGAYLGNWLDQRLKGFSMSWTISCILIGVFVGAMNVYLFIRETEE